MTTTVALDDTSQLLNLEGRRMFSWRALVGKA